MSSTHSAATTRPVGDRDRPNIAEGPHAAAGTPGAGTSGTGTPAAGTPGTGPVVLAAVTEEPLDVGVHEALVADPRAGAVVTFAGVVRDHDAGRGVRGIEYVAHPSAGRVLAEVAGDVAERCGVEAVAVSHRLGELAVGEPALVAAVSGAHRAEAFTAASLLIDEIKARLPVWKRQQFDDGSQEWVNCP